MNRPCQYAVDCEGHDLPFLNASSEAIDTLDYLAYGWSYGPGGNLPPLQQDWTLTACGVALFHSTSPIDAQLQAIADSIICDALQRYPGQPTTPGDEQTCCQPSPSGEVCFTINAGVITGRSSAEANAHGEALACYFARRTGGRTFALNDIANPCLEVSYVADLFPTGGVPPYIISIVSGALPPGLGFFQADARSATISGVPNAVGDYSFTVEVQDIAGNVLVTKGYTLSVMGITTGTMPDGTVGTAYSEQIPASGGAGGLLSFSAAPGVLPDGLTLSPFGLLSGTPETAEDNAFTVTVTDSTGRSCSRQLTMTVAEGCTADTGPNVPTSWSNPQPARVRVIGYSANAFGVITGCGNSGIIAIWDGTLPVRYAPTSFDIRWWPAGSAFPNITSYLIQNSAAVISLNYVPNFFGTHGAWHLSIDCLGGGVIWEGLKAVGLDPVGTYMRIASSQQSTGPGCLKIESY